MTLPGDIVNSTADGSTPARAATALCIWVCTLGVNEETSPSSSRAKLTRLIAGGEGGGDGGGGGGGGDGGGGEGEGGGAGQVEIGPKKSVRVIPKEQTLAPV